MKSATSILFRSRSFLIPVVLTAAKFVIVSLTLLCWSHESVAQTKVKTKDIKRAIEEGTLSKVEVICADTFKPGEKFSFDIQITMPDNSTTALGNDHDVIYKEAKIVIEKGTLSWDKRGEIKVHPVSVFFPDKGLDISVELGGLTTNKSVKPDFCYPFGYTINRKGQAGKKGSKGDPGPKSRPGSPGGPGTNGGSGANVIVQVEEEVIGDKTYMILLVNDEKHGFETGCGQVTLDVSGGDGGDGGKGGEGGDAPYGSNSKRSGPGGAGGNGGNGGDGGDGGNVTIGGPAYQKYRTMINIVSNGGPGGTFGFPGYYGSGAPNGAAGKVGLVGKSGKPGTITIKQ